MCQQVETLMCLFFPVNLILSACEYVEFISIFQLDGLVRRRRPASEMTQALSWWLNKGPGSSTGIRLRAFDSIWRIRECEGACEECASACSYLAVNTGRESKTYLYIGFTWVVAALCVGATKAVLWVPVCVCRHISGLLVYCVYLTKVHPQPCHWPSLQVGTAAARSMRLGQRDLLGFKMYQAGLQ